jgi:hypothetical protein
MKSIDLLAGVVRSPKARQRPSLDPSFQQPGLVWDPCFELPWLAFSPCMQGPLCVSPPFRPDGHSSARTRGRRRGSGTRAINRISTGWQSCGAFFAGRVRVVVTVVRACERGMQRGRRIPTSGMASSTLLLGVRPFHFAGRREKTVRMTP